jgi:predicted ester cyclase
MRTHDLEHAYTGYIACLNARDWGSLGRYVAQEVQHNARRLGLAGYQAMLEEDVRQIPDLKFNVELLVSGADHVACRLHFDCTPAGMYLGLPLNGQRVRFHEHVFYEFRDGKIVKVWSMLDRAALEKQVNETR